MFKVKGSILGPLLFMFYMTFQTTFKAVKSKCTLNKDPTVIENQTGTRKM